MGAIETLIVWENLDINRYVLKNNTSGETIIKHLKKEQDTVQGNFRDPDKNAELEVQDKLSLLEWFANEYRRFGCSLEFVTNKSQEGSQFCHGFGGIGVQEWIRKPVLMREGSRLTRLLMCLAKNYLEIFRWMTCMCLATNHCKLFIRWMTCMKKRSC